MVHLTIDSSVSKDVESITINGAKDAGLGVIPAPDTC